MKYLPEKNSWQNILRVIPVRFRDPYRIGHASIYHPDARSTIHARARAHKET